MDEHVMKDVTLRSVAKRLTCPPHFCQRLIVPEIDANPLRFYWGRGSVTFGA